MEEGGGGAERERNTEEGAAKKKPNKPHGRSRNADKMRQIWEAAGSEIVGVRERTVLWEA